MRQVRSVVGSQTGIVVAVGGGIVGLAMGADVSIAEDGFVGIGVMDSSIDGSVTGSKFFVQELSTN
jgi:hypothetical protein